MHVSPLFNPAPDAPRDLQLAASPLLPLHFAAEEITVYAKAEYLHPSGSIKDRLAACIFTELIQLDRLTPDLRIVEVSSGNTGIALARLGARLGVAVHILMSDSASLERRSLIRHCGADLTLFHADRGYLTGIALAEDMAAADPRVFLPRQFENPLNAADHARHTGPEILAQMPDHRVDAFVSGYGTGGTLAGCAQALRPTNPSLTLAAVEVVGTGSAMAEMPCCELIEGFTGGFRPPLLADVPLDATLTVSVNDTLTMTRRLAREFGLLVGPSSGANVCAALRLAADLGPDARVATILCDRADRYLSTALFAPERN